MDRRPGIGPVDDRCHQPGRWPGSTSTATSTATVSSNTRPSPNAAWSIRDGRIPEIRSSTPTARLADTPIALSEVQAYVYYAKRRMSELFELLGDRERAEELAKQAETLKTEVQRSFLDAA